MSLTRDQQRAQQAYARVKDVPGNLRADYKILVNDLGANILRSGLAAAMAVLERSKADAADTLLDHLAHAGIPGLTSSSGHALPGDVRALDVDAYLLASREMLKTVVWYKRAVQAQIEGAP